MNTVEGNFGEDDPGPGVDFASATHVYAAYNCTLFTDIDGNRKLSYAHDDAFVIVNATA